MESVDSGHTSRNNVGRIDRILSVALGGGLLIFGALRGKRGSIIAATGGYLIYRGVMQQCPISEALGISTAEKDTGHEKVVATAVRSIEIHRSLTIQRPASELYAFWRDFSNLPKFMKHLESVTSTGDIHSHWIAKAPAGMRVAWDAQITEERENELIAWKSLFNPDVQNEGSVRFAVAPADRGTEVHIWVKYYPPFGIVGSAFAKLFGEEPSIQIAEDLRRFKQLMETGVIPEVEGQTSGRKADDAGNRDDLQKRFGDRQRDIVEEASWESFPASDAPAW